MITVKPISISKKAIIVISLPYAANWYTLNSLQNGCFLNCESSNTSPQKTALLFSMYKVLENKFSGNALDAARAKFATVRVDTQQGNSIFTIETEPTFSAVRKILSLFVKAFQPSKVFQIYKKICSILKVKADSGEFSWCVDEMIKASKQIHFFVTGLVKVPEGKNLKDIIDLKLEPCEAKAQSVKTEPIKHPENAIKASSSLDAFLMQTLLNSMNFDSNVCDLNVIISGNRTAKVDTARIDRFIDQKILKLGDKLANIMLLLCAKSGYFTAEELNKLPTSYDSKKLKASLSKLC